MSIRLPVSRQTADIIAEWLQDRTGVEARYFRTKVTNKFPGISQTDIEGGVSGIHLYLEATNITGQLDWYGKLNDLRSEDQVVWYSALAPKDFEGSSYYQYCGIISGIPIF